MDFHSCGELYGIIAAQALRLGHGHGPGDQGWGEINQPVALRDILAELRDSRGAVCGRNIPSAHAACHRCDDFHPVMEAT